MSIKRNIEITAEVLNTKASRLQATARAEQAERLLRMDEARPATTKVKKGVQAERGRTRVERARSPMVTAKHILQLENMLADMAIAEVMRDERGYWYQSPQYVGLRWTHPPRFACGVGSTHQAVCWYSATIEGLMAFEAELYYRGVLPREYVTPDDIVVVTGRQLGK